MVVVVVVVGSSWLDRHTRGRAFFSLMSCCLTLIIHTKHGPPLLCLCYVVCWFTPVVGLQHRWGTNGSDEPPVWQVDVTDVYLVSSSEPNAEALDGSWEAITPSLRPGITRAVVFCMWLWLWSSSKQLEFAWMGDYLLRLHQPACNVGRQA